MKRLLPLLLLLSPAVARADEQAARAAFERARQLHQAGQLEDALDAYRETLQEDRRLCEARFWYAEALLAVARPGEALMQAQENQRCAEDGEQERAEDLVGRVRVALAGGPVGEAADAVFMAAGVEGGGTPDWGSPVPIWMELADPDERCETVQISWTSAQGNGALPMTRDDEGRWARTLYPQEAALSAGYGAVRELVYAFGCCRGGRCEELDQSSQSLSFGLE